MPFRLDRLALWLALTAVGFLLVLAVAYFAHGSLEDVPTAEQTDNVRVVAGLGAVLLLGIELGLWSLLRRTSRGKDHGTEQQGARGIRS